MSFIEAHNLHQVLITVVQGATDFPDPNVSLTFTQLSRSETGTMWHVKTWFCCIIEKT